LRPEATVAGQDNAVVIHEDRRCKAKLANAFGDGSDLAL
jgi:hypothetical protein